MLQSSLRLSPIKCLHIIFGDHSQSAWLTSCFPDPVLVWSEVAATGPAIGLVSFEERARHLESIYPMDHLESLTEMHRMIAVIEAYQDCGEIVFWFGTDLVNQTNLFYLISLFKNQKTDLAIVPYSREQIAKQTAQARKDLFRKRVHITEYDREIAFKFWQSLSSRSPDSLLSLEFPKDSILSFESVRQRYLTRFPSQKNGLNYLEQMILKGAHDGVNTFGDLYQYFLINDYLNYGCDEWIVWERTRALNGAINFTKSSEEFDIFDATARNRVEISLACNGHQLLNNEIDYVKTYGIDRWVGGVHLLGYGPVWRYTEDSQLVYE